MNLNYNIGPIPWPGKKYLSLEGFDKASKKTTTHRTSKGGTYRVHQLIIDFKNGNSISLCGGVLGSDGVDFMLGVLEEKLIKKP